MKPETKHLVIMIIGSVVAVAMTACGGASTTTASASYQMGYNAAVDWLNHGDPSLTQSHYGGLGMCKVMLNTAQTRAASPGEPKPSSESDYLSGCQDALKKAGW